MNAGVGYNVFLIAQNAKGRSNSTVRQVYTLKSPEKQTDVSLASAPAIANMKPFLAILLGCVGGMMLIAIIIVLIVRMRGSSGRDRAETYPANTQRTIQSSQEVGLVRDLCNASVESIEKNPDIIPQGEKLREKFKQKLALFLYKQKSSSNFNFCSLTSSLFHFASVRSVKCLCERKKQQSSVTLYISVCLFH